MTNAKILTSIEDAYNYLSQLGLASDKTYKAKNLSPNKYSEKYFQTFHGGNYEKTFIIASEEQDYDIILKDGSFFQFTARDTNDIHYSYFPVFEKTLSFNEFIDQYGEEETEYDLENAFEQYLSTDRERVFPCPIRYDVSLSEYIDVVHPYAHLHIGVNTNIRIPVDKIIKPLSFVDFVIKNTYKEQWDKAYRNDDGFREKVLSLKNRPELLSENLFSSDVKKMIHIT